LQSQLKTYVELQKEEIVDESKLTKSQKKKRKKKLEK